MDNTVRQQLAFRDRGFYQFNEIDAKNIYVYRIGSEFESPIVAETNPTERVDYLKMLKFHSLDLALDKYVPVFSKAYRFNITFTSTESFNGEWMINVNHKDSFLKEIRVKKGENTFSAILPVDSGFLHLEQYLTDKGTIASVSLKVSCVHRAIAKTIRAKDLGRSAFYIQELYMKPGESIALDDLQHVIANTTSVPRLYDFPKPIATSGFTILFGSPEIVFYCFEEESRA